MPFSVDEFKAEVNRRRGLARASNFRMLITGGVLKNSSARALAMLLNSAQIPGRQLQTINVTTHGVVRKQPYGMSVYDDLTVGVYCTNENLFPRDLFQEWQELIINSENHNANYFDQYVCNIELESYDDQGNINYTCQFQDAYPMFVAPIQVDWNNGNQILNLNVSFAYRKWRMLPIGGNPFGGNLAINALYPNFDLAGFIDTNAVGIVDRASGQVFDKVKTAGRFLSNI
jgi:hypothetical protein